MTKKEKIIKILQVLIVFIAIDFIASSLVKIPGLLGTISYLFSGALIIIYGFYLHKKKDDYLLKTFFYFIIIFGFLKIFLIAIDNI